MKMCKRIACVVLTALLMLGMLLASGCSTPKYAVTIDGRQYETGEYLAYLYLAYDQSMQEAQYYVSTQNLEVSDVWLLMMPYDDGGTTVSLEMEVYIQRLAKDMMIRQRAVENKMAEYGITPEQEQLDELNAALAQYSEQGLLSLGFNKAHFADAFRAVEFHEEALFYGLYDGETNPDAPFKMAEEDIRAYFDQNYLSYKIISLPLADEAGVELNEAGKQAVYDRLDGYLAIYNETGDFNKAIEQFNADEKADGEEGEATDDTSAAGDAEEEPAEDRNRIDINAATYTDTEFLKALRSVPVGEAQRVEYKRNAITLTASVILRMDPEAGEGREDYYAQSRRTIIFSEKQAAYDEFLEAYIAEIAATWTPDTKAIDMCSPKNFAAD